ncbi:hypothetical protein ACJX0J_020375, partial [Zea mays]
MYMLSAEVIKNICDISETWLLFEFWIEYVMAISGATLGVTGEGLGVMVQPSAVSSGSTPDVADAQWMARLLAVLLDKHLPFGTVNGDALSNYLLSLVTEHT